MKIAWGTYPNNLGHTDFPGCFRCHDGNHVNKEGTAIQQDCNTCHVLLAVEEKDPPILKQLTTAWAQEPSGDAPGPRALFGYFRIPDQTPMVASLPQQDAVPRAASRSRRD